MNNLARIAFTPGEPAGIGPDLAVILAQQDYPAGIVAIADPALLQQRADLLELPLRITELTSARDVQAQRAGHLQVLPQALGAAVTPGQLDPKNARYVLNTLDCATDSCRNGDCHALLTGPVNKAIINDAGIAFDGHTGYLAARCGADEPVMMLATKGLKVALASIHIPLSAVPGALTQAGLQHTLRVLEHALRTDFAIERPHILVAGLNPHAGESGYLGREEIEIIEPVLRRLRAQGLHLTGPLPADTLFTPHKLATCDAVLAMYHDQGLPVIKHLGFGNTVNVTLGLPIIRTSVDHGTALDIAGSRQADPGSLRAALEMAVTQARNRHART